MTQIRLIYTDKNQCPSVTSVSSVFFLPNQHINTSANQHITFSSSHFPVPIRNICVICVLPSANNDNIISIIRLKNYLQIRFGLGKDTTKSYNNPCVLSISARSECFFEYSRSIIIRLDYLLLLPTLVATPVA